MSASPAAMLHTSEGTTGALLRDVAQGRLHLALAFGAGQPPEGVALMLLRDEPAVVHMPADSPLATRASLTLGDEQILVAATTDSIGYSGRVLAAFAAAGISPRTRVDPSPDLGLQAVRDSAGVVVYARSAYPRPSRLGLHPPHARGRPALPPRLAHRLAIRRPACGARGRGTPFV